MIILLSLDSGSSTLKLMMKFIRNKPSQSTNEVTLLAQASETSESFEDIHAAMGPVCEEISNCTTIPFVLLKKKSKFKHFLLASLRSFTLLRVRTVFPLDFLALGS